MRSKGRWFRGTLKFGSSWGVKPNLESFALLFRLKKGVQPSCNCLTCASTCDCFQRLDTVWAENHVLAADVWAHRGRDSSRVYKGVRVCRAHMFLKCLKVQSVGEWHQRRFCVTGHMRSPGPLASQLISSCGSNKNSNLNWFSLMFSY